MFFATKTRMKSDSRLSCNNRHLFWTWCHGFSLLLWRKHLIFSLLGGHLLSHFPPFISVYFKYFIRICYVLRQSTFGAKVQVFWMVCKGLMFTFIRLSSSKLFKANHIWVRSNTNRIHTNVGMLLVTISLPKFLKCWSQWLYSGRKIGPNCSASPLLLLLPFLESFVSLDCNDNNDNHLKYWRWLAIVAIKKARLMRRWLCPFF